MPNLRAMPTREQMDHARQLKPGRALDQAMADALMRDGMSPKMAERSRWSSDERAIAMLIDLKTSILYKEPLYITITCEGGRGGDKWECVMSGLTWEAEGRGNTMALAFCRAYLHEDLDTPWNGKES